MGEVFDWENEFRPLDDEAVDSLLQLAAGLQLLKKNNVLSHDELSIVEQAAHQLPRLLAMTVGGYSLYITSLEHASALSSEVDRLLGLCNQAGIDELTSWSVANDSFKMFVGEITGGAIDE